MVTLVSLGRLMLVRKTLIIELFFKSGEDGFILLMKSEKGFLLTEILLSLAALFIIALVLIPNLVHFAEQRRLALLKYEANNILYEKLLAVELDGQGIESETILVNGSEFNLKINNISGQVEVCVHYDKEQAVCDYIY